MDALTGGFIKLGREQAILCAENPPVYCELLVTAPSQRLILMNIYRVLVRENMLVKIEHAPEETKRQFWEMAKADAKDRLTIDKLITLSTCLYCLDYLLQNP